MLSPMSNPIGFFQLIRSAFDVFVDVLTFFRLTFRTPSALAAENLTALYRCRCQPLGCPNWFSASTNHSL
jgi:hypothetical protein